MLPLLATPIERRGNGYSGLWDSIIVALMTVVIGAPFPEGDQTRPNPLRAQIP
jgi:hypothetical protein